MNSVRSLIVVGGLTAGVIGGSWAWSVSHAASSEGRIVANSLEQNVVELKPAVVSNVKKNKSLSLPAMYAAVPLSHSHATVNSTRAPEPPSGLPAGPSIEVPIEVPVEVVLPAAEVTSQQIESNLLLDKINENESNSSAVSTSPSEEKSAVVETETRENLITNSPSSAAQSRPVDYGRLNQRLIQVADALERLNLRLAAMAAKDNKDQSEADASKASAVAAETVAAEAVAAEMVESTEG